MTEKRLIITCMKNEGPFIVEWVAYHRSIGFTDFLVFTNECEDGTVELLDALQDSGLVTRMDNPYLTMEGNFNPQKGALRYAEGLDLVKSADRILISDVDEYVNIHVGDGTVDDLLTATDGADVISMMWRLFGNADITAFQDAFVTEQFTRCAPEFCPRPIQAWAVKSLFSTDGPRVAGYYKRFGVHRPLIAGKGAARNVRWVNGSGKPVLGEFRERGWRFGTHSLGYGLVTLNHYAVRSADSFLVKRDRGRVNHVDRDQGLAYWLRMNFNMETDTTIQRHLPRARREYDRIMQFKGVNAAHTASVAAHKAKVASLLEVPENRAFHGEITDARLRLISRHLNLLSRDIFNEGPAAIPQDVFDKIAQVPDLSAA